MLMIMIHDECMHIDDCDDDNNKNIPIASSRNTGIQFMACSFSVRYSLKVMIMVIEASD